MASRTLWAVVAAASVAAAIVAGVQENGRERIALLLGTPSGGEIARLSADIAELKSETRLLALENQALAAKLAALEGEGGTITASAADHSVDAIEPLSSPEGTVRVELTELPLAGVSDEPETITENEILAGLSNLASAPPSTRATAAAMEDSRFALELGIVDSVDEARALWARVSQQSSDILGDAEATVATTPGMGGTTVYRLLVGPFSNAATALNACVSMTVRGIKCDPAAYEAQALAIR